MIKTLDDNRLYTYIEMAKGNNTIQNAFAKASSIISKFDHPACSISGGGGDSDVMLDIISKVDTEHRVKYVWFDTGVEYQATKSHLGYLQDKYKIKIHKQKAIKPIPLSCTEYGQPFLSKYVSEQIDRLQRHGFQWENESYDILVKRYPYCKSSLKWWTNNYQITTMGFSRFNINNNYGLREFIIGNPPPFKISNKCCKHAKKAVAHQYAKDNKIDLWITGIRKSEGGIRASAYKDCFTDKNGTQEISQYRPLFWFSNDDKTQYEKLFGIRHSDCYEVYGLTRTGCVGCPYGRSFEQELAVAEQYEPKLYKAVCNIFKDSYDYTRQYREFVRKYKENETQVL